MPSSCAGQGQPLIKKIGNIKRDTSSTEPAASSAPVQKPATGVELRAQIWRRSPRALPIAGFCLLAIFGGVFLWLAIAGDPEDAAQIARVKLERGRSDPSGLLRRGDNEGDQPPYYENYATPDAGNPDEGFTPSTGDVDFETAIITPPEEAGAPQPTAAKATYGELSEQGTYGPLPKIGKNGRKPSDAYARPFAIPKTNRPAGYVAILIGGMGLSQNATANAIAKLPADISLSFAPYGANLNGWVKKARGRGHEIALELPLEPFDYPDNDPGPYTLLTTSAENENLDRLNWLLSRATDYALVTNYQGAKFTGSDAAMTPFLKALSERGLIFVDNGGAPRTRTAEIAPGVGLNAVIGDRIIDGTGSAESIDAALADLEALAREKGFALGIGSAFPLTVERVQAWAAHLRERNLMLVPVSAAKRVKASQG